jgi:hypothetical protein
MNLFHVKIALVLGFVLAPTTSILLNTQPAPYSEGTTIANYNLGHLINIPNYLTQPYILAAQAGCPIVDRPVCGVDGKTYQNECFIKLVGVAKAYDGWCIGNNQPKPVTPPRIVDPLSETEETGFLRVGTPTTGSCPCNNIFYPVCSSKGVTYANLCRAKCNGEYAVQVGACNNFYYVPVPNLTCSCTYTQELVCSKHNVTYENSCVMTCAKDEFKSLDKCETPCNCDFMYKPVCGINGRNYINDCYLRCDKVQRAFEGRCETSPLQKCLHCIGDISPVCGTNGRTYENICYLKCNAADLNYQGNCLPPSPDGTCICPKIYLPVCDTDGKNFENECTARCNGKKIAYNGVCKVRDHKRRFRSWRRNSKQGSKGRDYSTHRKEEPKKEAPKKDKSGSDEWIRSRVVFAPIDDKRTVLVGSNKE